MTSITYRISQKIARKTVCRSSASMNVRNLFEIDCIIRLLDLLSRSISLYLLLTRLILYTAVLGVLLFPPDPFFLSVILRSFNTFMLQSANCNMVILFMWVWSDYAGVSGPIDHLCIGLHVNSCFKYYEKMH